MNEPRTGSGPGQQPHLPPAASPTHGLHPHHAPHHAPQPPQTMTHQVGPGTLRRPSPVKEAPIELEGDDQPSANKIVASGGEPFIAAHKWQRAPQNTQKGAVRVRSFHCRLSEQGLEFMDNAINLWLDAHPEIEVKFTSSVVGQFDGKLKEPAYILSLWY